MAVFNQSLKNAATFAFIGILSYFVFLIEPNAYPLSSDECFSLYHAQFPVPTIWKELSKGNNPPLFETLLHYWIQIMGIEESTVRALAACIVSLSAAALWFLAKRLFHSPVSAWISWLLFVGSNTVLLFAHEIRAYGLFLFWSILVHGLWLIPNSQKKTIHKFAWSFSAAAMVYSHFFGFWILLVQFLYESVAWFKQSDRRSIKFIPWPWLLLVALYLPYLRVVWVRFLDSANSGTWMEAAPWEGIYFTLWKFVNVPLAVFPTVVLIGMIVYTLAKKPEKESHRLYLPYLLGAFLIPLLGMWLISLPTPISIPMFNERYSSFVIPPMMLLLGSYASLDISKLKPIIPQYGYKIGLLLLLLVSQYVFRGVTVTQNSDVRMVVNELKKMDGTTIILEPDHAAFQWLYYTDQKKFQQWRSDSMYHHMTQQLIQNQVFILRTKNSLDSLKLAAKTNLFYVHLDNRKTAHTQLIETQLAQRFTIRKPTNPHIPNSANAFRSKTTEFWELIPQ